MMHRLAIPIVLFFISLSSFSLGPICSPTDKAGALQDTIEELCHECSDNIYNSVLSIVQNSEYFQHFRNKTDTKINSINFLNVDHRLTSVVRFASASDLGQNPGEISMKISIPPKETPDRCTGVMIYNIKNRDLAEE